MQTIGSVDGRSVLVEIDIHIGVVCGPVGEIDRQEGDFAQNGRIPGIRARYRPDMQKIGGRVEGVWWLRCISKLGWVTAQLARLISGRGISP
jgi:hypothetical protein